MSEIYQRWNTDGLDFTHKRTVKWKTFSWYDVFMRKGIQLWKREPGPWFSIKMSYQYRKSHCGDKNVLRSSYLHNGTSYSGKTSSSYWSKTSDQRKHQSSALLAFVRGIHQWLVNSPHKGPVTRKIFHLMTSSWNLGALWEGMEGSDCQITLSLHIYRKTSNISHTLVDNKTVDNSDVVGASPVGAAPTTSSFST